MFSGHQRALIVILIGYLKEIFVLPNILTGKLNVSGNVSVNLATVSVREFTYLLVQ